MDRIKRFIKESAPPWLAEAAKPSWRRWVAFTVHLYDRKKFNQFRMHRVRDASLAQLEGKLTFHAHSIEKGLSHADMRPEFGHVALTGLADALHEYRRQSLPTARSPYENALSTLNAYVGAHRARGIEVDYVKTVLGVDLLAEVERCPSDSGGVTTLASASKDNNHERNFAELFLGRSSVREFAPVAVSQERLMTAIRLTLKAPSVCNRQSVRVKILTDSKLIRDVLSLQNGMKGHGTPPLLLAVTGDLSAFLGPTERNQAFIDGGLFSMALLLSLEYEQLAACPLNAMFTPKTEEALRTLMGLSESERIIMFIAVGEFPDETLVPKSFRISLEDVASTCGN